MGTENFILLWTSYWCIVSHVFQIGKLLVSVRSKQQSIIIYFNNSEDIIENSSAECIREGAE